MSVTIHDVARLAGVSPATVSLVLRKKGAHITPATQQRVLDAADALNYTPNQVAVSLVTKRTHTIGLIHSDMLNLFYSELAVGIERNARLNGYSLIICNSEEQIDKCISDIAVFQQHRIDGFVLQPPETVNSSTDQLERLVSVLDKCETPFVILDRAIHNLFHDYIAADHELGGRIATDFLYQLGHRRIGCVTGSLSDYGSRRRLRGYRQVLERHNLPYDESLIFEGLFQIESGYRGAQVLFERGVTAIFAFSDMIAIGVQRYAAEKQISIPGQMSLIGYDDNPIAAICSVPLTTIRQPIETIGARACEILLDRINKVDRPFQDYFYPPALVQRNSCTIPRSGPLRMD